MEKEKKKLAKDKSKKLGEKLEKEDFKGAIEVIEEIAEEKK